MNYFLQPSELPYELPDFEAVDKALEDGSIIPAFQTAIDDHAAEIAAIANNPSQPTWENTFEALEESGEMLDRVLAVVFNYSGSMATDKIQDIEAKISPVLAAHTSDMLLNEKLWKRIQAIPAAPEGGEEEALQKYWTRRFVRGGANLDKDQRATLRDIDAQLAELTTAFGTTLQQATADNAVLFTDADQVEGLSESEKAYFAQAAKDEGKQGWLIRLGLPSVQPILESLTNPEARAHIHEASLHRAKGATHKALLQIAQLRARRANLLGYDTHADFVAEVETAGNRQAVEELLNQLTPAAVANAWGEYKRAADKRAVSEDAEGTLSSADWPYWAGKLRSEELSVDEAELKKYFPLDSVLEAGAFYAAERLYGIKVTRREDLTGYHPDVKVWEVTEGDSGEGIGLLLTDMYARPTKRGGAWMSSFVDQSNLKGQAPVVVNVMNIAKPAAGEQALLTIDEVMTVFHEFGHGLHGLLSDVRYPSLSGTSVPRDFVEFPSQINENWALEPEILANYARHVDTGEPLPAELVQAVREQSKWGQGFATTEYLAACWVDLAWHTLSFDDAQQVTDVEEFEASALQRAGVDMDGMIAPRYRSEYFNHVFAGGYSAGYWSYLWAEVLDADGFQAFVDTGAARGESVDEDIDPDDVRAAGDRFRRMILSRGATIDYEDAFWMFRGQQKSVEPLLRRRGLDGAVQ
ncbi:M3 family metallopeptidase [Corynebacterium auriscanis]|uniref:M3 family metallopeptidase n=1 Tax=Corynebacterium auriscanis TaxID=99807 RepID=UPI0024AD30E4|nr:M3 family metallopeptidase [Corynebacterium auriscanis]